MLISALKASRFNRKLDQIPAATFRLAGSLAIIVAVVLHLPSLGQPLLEAHSFRQTQTAFTALLFHETGIDLFHSKLPVLGAPWEVPFEFPLFQALASIVMDLGIAPDAALRLTALLSFAATALLVWRLIVHIAGDVAGWFGLVAFLFSPFAMLWSRASLVEFLATAAAVAYVFFALRWVDGTRWGWFVAALAVGTIALLAKVTTGVVYLLPVAAVSASGLAARRSRNEPVVPFVLASSTLLAVPVVAAAAWTGYTDAIKAASEFTAWLTSANLAEWNFGSLSQKLSLPDWVALVETSNGLLYGGLIWIWTPVALVGAYHSRRRWVALALVASAWVGPALFTNLYFVHDYYLAAVSPLVAVGIGLAAGWLWESRRSWWAAVSGVLLGVLWFSQIVFHQGYWTVQYMGTVDGEGALVAASEIAANSRPDELVVVTSRGWSPAALYYARRWGLMLFEPLESTLSPGRVRELRSLGYNKLFDCPRPSSCRTVDLRALPADVQGFIEGITTTPPAFMTGATIRDGGACNIEAVDGIPWQEEIVEAGSLPEIDISGWAFDVEGEKNTRAAYVRLASPDGRAWYVAASVGDRPDVAAHFGMPEVTKSGLRARFSSRVLPPGDYEVVVFMDSESGPLACAQGRRLRIVSPLVGRP